MNRRFTHFACASTIAVDLLAGDVFKCSSCEVTLFRDYAFLEDGGGAVAGEPDSKAGQLALGRAHLPDDAEPVNKRQNLCESCSIEAGLV